MFSLIRSFLLSDDFPLLFSLGIKLEIKRNMSSLSEVSSFFCGIIFSSISDIKGEILVVPQFTLYADCSGGNRPFFGQSARPEVAEPLFEKFIAELKKSGLKIEKGRFGAKMKVELINNGPVTIILDSNG